MFQKGNIIEDVEVTGMGTDGKSIARIDNFVLFVEDAVPGDLTDVFVFRKKKSFGEGKAVKIKRPSVDRVQSFCQHFGTCGGCKWQHLAYEKQLFYKQQQVTDALERIGKLEMPVVTPILGSAHQRYYRNKLEFTFSNRAWLRKEELTDDRQAEIPALGFHVPLRFDKILDIKTCYLQDDLNNAIRLEVKNFCLSNNISFFDLVSQQGTMRNLIIRNTSTGEWMVIVVFHGDDAHARELLMNYLKEKFPFITSLQYIVNNKKNDSIFDQDVQLFYGRDFIIEKMEEINFRISAKSFYQTNSLQAYELYKIAREYAGLTGNEIVYDLYTGTGTIAAFVSGKAKKVIGIDYIEDAIKDARQNSLDNNIENNNFFSGDIKDVLNTEFVNKNGRPDVIITDPPRAGMHPDVIKSILECDPQRIVYVSCNPSTQARDLQLMEGGYRIEKIQPVDMFPHTAHVENVVLMVKRNNKNEEKD